MNDKFKKMIINMLACSVVFKTERKALRNRLYDKYLSNKKSKIKDPFVEKFSTIHDVQLFLEHLNCAMDDKISILDIGARGGLQSNIFAPLINFDKKYVVGIEPEPEACIELRNNPNLGKYDKIIDTAIGLEDKESTLFITKHHGCTSLLEPNIELLNEFKFANKDWFSIEREVNIKTTKLKTIFNDEAFDFIKIDIQGLEYDILENAPDAFLKNAVGFCLEGQLIEFYKDQKLLGDLINLLQKNDFWILKLEPHSSTLDGLDFECDIHVIKNPNSIKDKSDLYKHCLFALLSGKGNYVSFLLRNYGHNIIGTEEVMYLTDLLDLSNTEEEFILPVVKC